MHTYLRSIGFTKVDSPKEVEKLKAFAIEKENSMVSYDRANGSKLVERVLMTSEKTGLITRGIEEPNGEFHVDHMVPFCTSDFSPRPEEEVTFSKKIDTEAYNGMCDDDSIGISMIFYLKNEVYYLRNNGGMKVIDDCDVSFSGLSTSGMIILPVFETSEDVRTIINDNNEHMKLMEEAKNGSQEAIASLTIEDIDKYEMINERIKNEDLYSIVSTSFCPYGSESDIYQIIGKIRTVNEDKNRLTEEEIWILGIEINTVIITVAINKKDLLGEPIPGRRFKGNCWLQGEIGVE